MGVGGWFALRTPTAFKLNLVLEYGGDVQKEACRGDAAERYGGLVEVKTYMPRLEASSLFLRTFPMALELSHSLLADLEVAAATMSCPCCAPWSLGFFRPLPISRQERRGVAQK